MKKRGRKRKVTEDQIQKAILWYRGRLPECSPKEAWNCVEVLFENLDRIKDIATPTPQIRMYPLLVDESVLDTMEKYLAENPDCSHKDAWRFAESFHRGIEYRKQEQKRWSEANGKLLDDSLKGEWEKRAENYQKKTQAS